MEIAKRIIIILFTCLALGIGILLLVGFEKRFHVTTKSGIELTIWDNYIIFEHYTKMTRPKENYIVTSDIVADFGYLVIQLRKDSTMVICTGDSFIGVELDDRFKHKDIYTGYDYDDLYNKYYPPNDTMAYLIIDCDVFRSTYIPKITEYSGNKIIETTFEKNYDFFCKSVIGKKHISIKNY